MMAICWLGDFFSGILDRHWTDAYTFALVWWQHSHKNRMTLMVTFGWWCQRSTSLDMREMWYGCETSKSQQYVRRLCTLAAMPRKSRLTPMLAVDTSSRFSNPSPTGCLAA
jgi:hypothetical protein